MSFTAATPSRGSGGDEVLDAARPDDAVAEVPTSGEPVRADTTWPLWVSHLVVPLVVVAAFLAVAAVERASGWPGVALAGAALVAAAWRARSVPAAVAGVVVWWGAAALLGLVVVAGTGPARTNLQGVAAGFGVVAVTAATTALRWRPASRPTSPAGRARALADGAFRPDRAWAAWIVGAGLGAPLAAMYTPTILDVDSAWIVMATAHGRQDGLSFLQQTQEVLLPQAVLGPLLRTWGYQGAIAFTIVMVLALAGFVSAFAYHLCRRPLAAFVAGGALLAMPSIAGQASRLPMYATMLLLGYGGALLVHRAMAGGPHRWWYAVGGGVALALAPEAHSLGQLFLAVPFLLLVLHPTRTAARSLLATVAALVVTTIPRAFINLSIDGLSRLRSNRTDWLVEQGYLRMINERLHNQRSNDGPLAYLGNVPKLLTDALGPGVVVIFAVLIVAAAVAARRQTLLFGLSVTIAFVVALAIAAPATYGRYLTPLAVGAAAVAGVGAVALVEDRWRGAARPAAVVLLIGLVVGLSTSRIAIDVRHHQREVQRLSTSLHELADHVPEGASVLGVRSNVMVYVDPTLQPIYARTMSEEDFVTYLVWPSDEAVLRMMRRLGVSWVVVRESKFAEVKYHETWLRPVYGERDAHQRRIEESDRFCRVTDVNKTVLYRVGACPGTD